MNLNQLFPASFRGVPFLVSDTSSDQGVKTVVHEYPNSPRRYVEGMGEYKPVYKITGHITGDFYQINRFALLAALKDASLGILIHPFRQICIVAPTKPATVTESTRNLGECIIEMEFSEADPAINPTNSGSIISDIIAAADKLDDQIQAAFAKIFVVSSAFPQNFNFARAQINTISGQFNTFGSLFSSSADTSSLTAEQTSFTNSIVKNIASPVSLIAGVSSLFAEANNVSDDPNATGTATLGLFGFGSADPAIRVSTRFGPAAQGLERFYNNMAVNYAFNVYALMYAYLNFSQAQFDNEPQLIETEQVLEQQYQSLINGTLILSQPADIVDILGDDVLDSLEDIRNLAVQQFNADDVNVSKIIQINTKRTSATLLSYQYYGTTDQTENIISLNNDLDISFLSGAVNIVTDPSPVTA